MDSHSRKEKMWNLDELNRKISSGDFDERIGFLYGKENLQLQKERYITFLNEFEHEFTNYDNLVIYSAPGRTEIGGNHTDHQHGCVLAAGVNLDVIAVVRKNNDNKIRVKSKGYDINVVDLDDLNVKQSEKNTSFALIRGMAAKFKELGYKIGGFDAYTTSNVLKGSGLSSSAAFEVLIGTILSGEYNNFSVSPVEVAIISQYAENVYFGKPSGLMDQMASSVGNFVSIDFNDPKKPIINKVDFDFEKSGYNLFIVDTKGDHANLTDEYGAIPVEMKAVAKFFNKEVLRDVNEEDFYANIAKLRKTVSDRAILRSIHFFDDNKRAISLANALKNNNFDEFKDIICRSGRSSFMYLQNVNSTKKGTRQEMALALALMEKVLEEKGAFRVHGGGFAGTIQAFVPLDKTEEVKNYIEDIYGKDSCHILKIRPVGAVKF